VRCAAVLAVLAPLTAAHATDGYFSEGYSIINQGMGGASIAYPRDTLAIATNPADQTRASAPTARRTTSSPASAIPT
jgi:hypothetical protein